MSSHIYSHFIPVAVFIIVTLHHHTTTKGSVSGLFKAKTKNARVYSENSLITGNLYDTQPRKETG